MNLNTNRSLRSPSDGSGLKNRTIYSGRSTAESRFRSRGNDDALRLFESGAFRNHNPLHKKARVYKGFAASTYVQSGLSESSKLDTAWLGRVKIKHGADREITKLSRDIAKLAGIRDHKSIENALKALNRESGTDAMFQHAEKMKRVFSKTSVSFCGMTGESASPGMPAMAGLFAGKTAARNLELVLKKALKMEEEGGTKPKLFIDEKGTIVFEESRRLFKGRDTRGLRHEKLDALKFADELEGKLSHDESNILKKEGSKLKAGRHSLCKKDASSEPEENKAMPHKIYTAAVAADEKRRVSSWKTQEADKIADNREKSGYGKHAPVTGNNTFEESPGMHWLKKIRGEIGAGYVKHGAFAMGMVHQGAAAVAGAALRPADRYLETREDGIAEAYKSSKLAAKYGSRSAVLAAKGACYLAPKVVNTGLAVSSAVSYGAFRLFGGKSFNHSSRMFDKAGYGGKLKTGMGKLRMSSGKLNDPAGKMAPLSGKGTYNKAFGRGRTVMRFLTSPRAALKMTIRALLKIALKAFLFLLKLLPFKLIILAVVAIVGVVFSFVIIGASTAELQMQSRISRHFTYMETAVLESFEVYQIVDNALTHRTRRNLVAQLEEDYTAAWNSDWGTLPSAGWEFLKGYKTTDYPVVSFSGTRTINNWESVIDSMFPPSVFYVVGYAFHNPAWLASYASWRLNKESEELEIDFDDYHFCEDWEWKLTSKVFSRHYGLPLETFIPRDDFEVFLRHELDGHVDFDSTTSMRLFLQNMWIRRLINIRTEIVNVPVTFHYTLKLNYRVRTRDEVSEIIGCCNEPAVPGTSCNCGGEDEGEDYGCGGTPGTPAVVCRETEVVVPAEFEDRHVSRSRAIGIPLPSLRVYITLNLGGRDFEETILGFMSGLFADDIAEGTKDEYEIRELIELFEYTLGFLAIVNNPLPNVDWREYAMREGLRFGYRFHPEEGDGYGERRFHRGVDIPRGDLPYEYQWVYSAHAGTVMGLNRDNGTITVRVFWDRPFGFWTTNTTIYTLYLHLAYICSSLSSRDTIERGTRLGRMGSRNTTLDPHLHFEVHVVYGSGSWSNDTALNPLFAVNLDGAPGVAYDEYEDIVIASFSWPDFSPTLASAVDSVLGENARQDGQQEVAMIGGVKFSPSLSAIINGVIGR